MPIEFHRDGPWELPGGWAWARLGDLGWWTGGGTPSKSNAAFWTNGTIPWVSPKDMKTEIVGDSEDWITEDAVANSSTRRVRSDSVLMVVRSGILNHTFPVAICDREVTLNQDMRAITPSGGINSKYLGHALRRLQRQILDECSKDGTTVASVEPARLEETLIAPTAEQRRIVARIDELFAEIADGETAVAQARADLDTWRRALLKAAVTGKLTREWRENTEQNRTSIDFVNEVRAKARSRKVKSRRTGSAAAMSREDLPSIPVSWTWVPLGDLLIHLTSGSRDWTPFYDRGDGIFVLAQNVRPGRYDSATIQHVDPPESIEKERTRVEANDLLITIVGANTGDVCRVDFNPSNHFVCQSVALLRLADRRLSEFLAHALVSEVGQSQMRKLIYGAGRPHLSFDQIENINVPVPPETEIDQICTMIADQCLEFEDTVLLTEEHTAGSQLRQSILRSAFEGRLVGQDPLDESAERLLTRLGEITTATTGHLRGTRRKGVLTTEKIR